MSKKDEIIRNIDTIPSIPEAFFSQVSSNPDGIVYSQAVSNEADDDLPRVQVSATYTTVALRVRAVAHYLRGIGVQKGDKVAILSNSRPEWMEADLALLCLGAVSVGIYQSLPADDIGYILYDSGAKVVFAENQEQVDKLQELAGNEIEIPEIEDRPSLKTQVELKAVICFEDTDSKIDVKKYDEISGSEDEVQLDTYQDLTRSDLAALVYTSGTTGPPKGVMQTHGNHLANVRQAWQADICHEESRIMIFLPLAHSFARLMGYLAYIMPAQAHFAAISSTKTSKLNPASVTKDIREADVQILPIVPRLLEKMASGIKEKSEGKTIKAKILKLTLWSSEKVYSASEKNQTASMFARIAYDGTSGLRAKIKKLLFGSEFHYGISGGAKLNPHVAHFFAAIGIEILEGYGLTETCVATNVNRSGNNKIGTVGPVLASDIELKIAGDEEILFRGPNITSGYYNRDKATQESWDSEGWFHTGDLGALDENEYLSIVGRKKEILVSSYGKNIAPEPIEADLRSSKYISQALLIGDGRAFCAAIITLELASMNSWLKSNKISGGMEDFSTNQKVIDLIMQEAENVNKELAGFESIRKIFIAPIDFTVENNFLTPTFKVKRKLVLAAYENEIEELYNS